jgi:hypothetical protein
VQILARGKREILGEQRVPAKKRVANRLYLGSLASSVIKVRKTGGKKCWNLKP